MNRAANNGENLEILHSAIRTPNGNQEQYVTICTNAKFITDTTRLIEVIREHYQDLDSYILLVNPEKLDDLKEFLNAQLTEQDVIKMTLSANRFVNLKNIYGYRDHFKDPILDQPYKENPDFLENTQIVNKWKNAISNQQHNTPEDNDGPWAN